MEKRGGNLREIRIKIIEEKEKKGGGKKGKGGTKREPERGKHEKKSYTVKKTPGIQGGTTYDPHDPNLSHVKHFITIYPVQFVPFSLFPNERTIASSALSGDLLHTVGGIFALGGERGFPD